MVRTESQEKKKSGASQPASRMARVPPEHRLCREFLQDGFFARNHAGANRIIPGTIWQRAAVLLSLHAGHHKTLSFGMKSEVPRQRQNRLPRCAASQVVIIGTLTDHVRSDRKSVNV